METDVEFPPEPGLLRKVLTVFCPQTKVPLPWLINDERVKLLFRLKVC